MVLDTRCHSCGSFLYISAPCELCEWEKVLLPSRHDRQEEALAQKFTDKMTRHFSFII